MADVDTSHLHGTTNCIIWADTFDEVRSAAIVERGVDIAADPGTMMTWFANAMMAQRDEDRRAAQGT